MRESQEILSSLLVAIFVVTLEHFIELLKKLPM